MDVSVTHLRRAMLEELQRRNYAKNTIYYYLKAVERFAKHFHRPPDQLNHTHLREYQAYLLRERQLEPRTVKLHVSALRFFFVKTLRRPYLRHGGWGISRSDVKKCPNWRWEPSLLAARQVKT